MVDYLHNHKDFDALIRIVSAELKIVPALVVKDYWIMHVLYGLQENGYSFELKGGTSLSKGFGIIHRFSEDIDIYIHPTGDWKGLNVNPNNTKATTLEARRAYYEWLTNNIIVDGIVSVVRDVAFDNQRSYLSAGIRLYYPNMLSPVAGLKQGILLEAGFDQVTPNEKLDITSWAYDKAIASGVPILDNRAKEVSCYDPGHTFVEKLQTIATKFRIEQKSGQEKPNLMRQYYDVFSLLRFAPVQDFLGSESYHAHKAKRFPAADLEIPLQENQAFRLDDPQLRHRFKQRYAATAALYYKGQPPFSEILDEIHRWLHLL